MSDKPRAVPSAGRIKAPVAVPGDLSVAYVLSQNSIHMGIQAPRALCIDCAIYTSGIEHYRSMSAHEALTRDRNNGLGATCGHCGQAFTLSMQDAEALAWVAAMVSMDIRLAADEVLELIDGRGGQDEAFFQNELVQRAQRLARMVLEEDKR